MTYTIQKLNELSADFNTVYNKFKGSYDALKQNDLSGCSVVWCKGWAEPFCADYITEIFDNTIEARKILKKVPAKKEHTSEHYFKEGVAVYSAFYGEAGQLSAEKFFVQKENVMTGYMFSNTKKLYGITAEVMDNSCKIVEYSSAKIDEKENITLNSSTYHYEEKHIVKAEAVSEFKFEASIVLYDNPAYENVGLILTPEIPRMNPEIVVVYEFIYNADGIADEYTRTNYFYGKTTTHTWKMKKSLLKKYSECNIRCFTKQEL